MRILCADDNVHVLSLLTTSLRAKGFCVETAIDGRLALQKIQAAPQAFDVLITDCRMPRVDGFSFVDQARAAGYKGHVLVFASALTLDERQRYRALSVYKIVEKPDAEGELLRAIEHLRANS